MSDWHWENAAAGAIAGFATVAVLHPLDVVRTRFQVNDGRAPNLPTYKSTGHAIYTIARLEGLRGLYAGFYPAVLGSTISWGLYFFFYSRAKQRRLKDNEENLSPRFHLLSAAEAGALVCLCTNPIWLVKTRLQLQTPMHHNRPYSGLSDALKTILKEEGLRGLYKGIGPGILLVSHGAVQFTVYEELRKILTHIKKREERSSTTSHENILLDTVPLPVLVCSVPWTVVRFKTMVFRCCRGTTSGLYKHIGRHNNKKSFLNSKTYVTERRSELCEYIPGVSFIEFI